MKENCFEKKRKKTVIKRKLNCLEKKRKLLGKYKKNARNRKDETRKTFCHGAAKLEYLQR